MSVKKFLNDHLVFLHQNCPCRGQPEAGDAGRNDQPAEHHDQVTILLNFSL